ncbi:MAG: M1 family aminopeptidase [Acidobacteria bacterium]|nr:M1 family aminopeptidase [Acidobacteriota bacterium]MCA1637703.1 M1 family aminopeptidase [Acidobacteriota bacterium]
MLLRLLIFAFILMTTSIFAQTLTIETGVPQTLAKWRAANYSNVRYKLNITLEKGAPLMKGDIEIRVKLTDEGAKNDLILDWRQLSLVRPFANSPYAYAYEVNNADDSNISTLYKNEHLLIPKVLLKTGENVVKIKFAAPIATSGAAITRYVDKEDGAEYVYSLFVPSDASTAFPVFDQPDLKARFTLELTAPKDWKVVSNEDYWERTKYFCEENKPCNTKYLFNETLPISTYLFAFAAGSFTEFGYSLENTVYGGMVSPGRFDIDKHHRRNRELQGNSIFVRKSQAEKFKPHEQEVFRLNREAVKYLESYFDYKFPFPKYDLVLIPEFPFGGMEHAGATFLRESSVIFPSEPTANDYISRANLIFHEAAHQWFGDTVTMKWFDNLWLKEGFAEFMAYKTLEKVLPEYNAWKAFYERNKPLAYLTDSTRGTTPIYQQIPNLSAAKSAYGNIVYRKAPSFLRQAEFYLGEDKFQTAVRAFLKKHQFANAEWTDLVKEFELSSGQDLKDWANVWVKEKGIFTTRFVTPISGDMFNIIPTFVHSFSIYVAPVTKFKVLVLLESGQKIIREVSLGDKSKRSYITGFMRKDTLDNKLDVAYVFPNYQDYGYGIFLLDAKSRDYVLKNIQNERDDFLRSMMWGTLWDSVREAELAPRDYVELAIKNISTEKDELTIQTILGRVSTAMNYYLSDAQSKELAPQLETLLIEKMQNAPTLGQRITFYRAFLNVASTDKAQATLKDVLSGKLQIKDLKLKTKDRFDIVTKLLILSDKDAPNLLAELEKAETSDEAKRYAYAAKAGIATTENKQKFFGDFLNNKEISESYIETAFVPFNSIRHSELTLPFLENALKELPNLKRSRKIFFVNGWLAAFIGGQKSEQALQIVNKFLADNPNLDKDLRLKVLEVADGLERSVKIRQKFAGK